MTGEVKLDLARESRTGLSEAVFSEGKSSAQLLEICEELKIHEKSMLFTRLAQAQYDLINDAYPNFLNYDPISRTATNYSTNYRTPSIGKPSNHENGGGENGTPNKSSNNKSSSPVAIVSGGSSDVPVAREVLRTLEYYDVPSLLINDVGVAGLWRLTERLEEIREHKVVICIAGMDAALPTVLGGLISSAIIAVPTSVGYGMVKGGETALRSLLVSCASGISVVNIDNGYGAACAAVRIINQMP
ncbi:MAG: NCAIR mutase (PurE)-related protein [Candidatus Azotimanducaceae bacterium]|jgi:NCAIR mutase (PurE)-related protein